MITTKTQEGGDHYQFPIQPIEYTLKNKLSFCEGNVIKYVTRHRKKNGLEDLKKAMQYLNFLMESEYGYVDQVRPGDKKIARFEEELTYGEVQWVRAKKAEATRGSGQVKGKDQPSYKDAATACSRNLPFEEDK